MHENPPPETDLQPQQGGSAEGGNYYTVVTAVAAELESNGIPPIHSGKQRKCVCSLVWLWCVGLSRSEKSVAAKQVELIVCMLRVVNPSFGKYVLTKIKSALRRLPDRQKDGQTDLTRPFT